MKYIEFFFWVASFLIVYSYLLYPVILFSLSRLLSKKDNQTFVVRQNDDSLPSVSVVISAYNEEACIEERIKNLLSLEYPHDKIRLLIASDGSTDDTNAILNSFDDPRLAVFCFVFSNALCVLLIIRK